MKKLLLFLLLIVSASNIQAQDVIVKKDGSTIVCRVVEINSSEIVYKKWTDLNGSNYVMNRADASAINYQNGKRENLGEMTSNLYAPNNQNDGTQQFNDKALLEMNYANESLLRKARKLRVIGLVGGGVLLGVGTAWSIADNWRAEIPHLGIFAAGAVVWTSGFVIAAYMKQKQAYNPQASSIYQQEFKLKNGSSFTAEVDVLKDQILKNQTIGVGLSYNF